MLYVIGPRRGRKMLSITRLFIVFSLLALTLVMYTNTRAQGFAMTFGQISAISSGSITVLCDDGRVVTYPIADGAFVSLDGKPARIADLLVGQSARVAVGQAAATAIYAKTAAGATSGKITAIDGTSVSVLVPSGSILKFTLAPSTKLTIYGKPSTVSLVRVGMLGTVTVIDGVVTTVAIVIPDNAVASGKILTISPTAIAVVHDVSTPAAYTIASTTSIMLDGKPARVRDLRMGWQVQVTSDDGTTARTIVAYTPVVHGQAHHDGEGS